MSDDKITLDKEEYEEIVEQLERLSAKEGLEEYQTVITSKEFWDTLVSKLIATCFSVKVWILALILYVPLQLLKQNLITADNYTNILIVIAPAVVAAREYSKSKSNGTGLDNNQGGGFLSKVKSLFKI